MRVLWNNFLKYFMYLLYPMVIRITTLKSSCRNEYIFNQSKGSVLRSKLCSVVHRGGVCQMGQNKTVSPLASSVQPGSWTGKNTVLSCVCSIKQVEIELTLCRQWNLVEVKISAVKYPDQSVFECKTNYGCNKLQQIQTSRRLIR